MKSHHRAQGCLGNRRKGSWRRPVNHNAGEHVRKCGSTNAVEGHLSPIKRGRIGTRHKVGTRHLHPFCVEFDFRWDARAANESERMIELASHPPD
jgi:hypothetical protein